MRIGVIAGVFDPIHSGHIEFIESSIKHKKLDKVLIIIEKDAKHKKSFASFENRKKLVELSIKKLPQVSIYETSVTQYPLSALLPEIKKTHKEAKVYLLLGSDVAEHISTWKDAKELLEDIEIVEYKRKPDDISSGKVRQQIKTGRVPEVMPKAQDFIRLNKLYLS